MRKYVIYCLVALLLIGLVPIGSSAAEDDGIYEVIIYPNGKGIQTLSGEESLVLGDVEVSYEVNYFSNEIDIYFAEPIFIYDVVSEGNTIHKTIKTNDDEEIEINKELRTNGFMFAGVSSLEMQYEDINNVEYIKIQSGEEPDFSGGLLDGVEFRRTRDGYLIDVFTDNDLSTMATVYGGTATMSAILYDYEFDNPVDIGSMKIAHSWLDNQRTMFNIVFYDKDGIAITSVGRFGRSTMTVEDRVLNINDVKRILITAPKGEGGRIYEFNVYSRKPMSEVSELNCVVNGKNAMLSWVNPDDDSFAGVNIYRNDVLIEENYMENNYIDEGLQPGTYEYKITTTDIFGNESKGITISAEIEKPPEEVKNLNYTVEDNSKIILTWKNPDNENFEGVNIYRDGKLIATTTEESFTESLSPGIYEYRITTIEAGKESPGVTIDVSVEFVSPPTVVKNIRIFNRTSTGGTVTWDLNPAFENVEKYIIYVNGEKHGEIEAPPYPLEGLEEGKTYTISVQAVNSYGTSEPPTAITYTPTKLSEIKDTIKINDIFSYLSMLFKNMWPLLALVLAIILSPKIYNLIKSNVT